MHFGAATMSMAMPEGCIRKPGIIDGSKGAEASGRKPGCPDTGMI